MPYDCNYQKYFIKSGRCRADLANFQLEFNHMRNLQKLMEEEKKELYLQLFPQYYFLNTSDDIPSLLMEKLHGETLEDFLGRYSTHQTPRLLLTHRQIRSIYEQIHNAIFWLFRGHMLHLDISPQNIFLVNNTFDNIRFIDFTGCYYTDLTLEKNIERGYNRLDYRINPDLPLPQQLRDSCALLFTRLFFSGNNNYNTYFSSNRKESLGNKNYRFFQNHYPNLLPCIFSPNTPTPPQPQDCHELLADWESWYQRLLSLL